MKSIIVKALSLGVHEDLSESKKVAIQIGTLDAYWSFTCIASYLGIALYFKTYPIAMIHLFSLFVLPFSLWLLSKKRYDLGRFLIHFVCIYEVFFTVDCYPPGSGIELFYFPTIMIPFITFSVDEQWKGNIQVFLASLMYFVQTYLGTGLVMEVNPLPVHPGVAVGFVLTYIPLILGFLRWQVKNSRDKVLKQQEQLLQSSTVKAIGEMSVEIAHEINNPLTALSLQLAVVKENGSGSPEQFAKMEETIQKMGCLVQGIKNLGSQAQKKEDFVFSKVLEDILSLSADRIKEAGIKVFINGDSDLKVYGHSIQISQVLMHLFTNAFNSLKDVDGKWIRIEISRKNDFIHFSFITGAKKFTADLDVSKSILENNSGSIFMDPLSSHPKIVMLLPIA